jgi:hypothetical protein
MKSAFCFFILLSSFLVRAQNLDASEQATMFTDLQYNGGASFKKKLYQRNFGAIAGIQKGSVTAVEFGAEMHWRKMSFSNPRITGATTNFSYNFGKHTIGYSAGMWMKHGRVNLTYGGNVVYYDDFKGLQRYGLGPVVGFRLAGFHLQNGFNFLAGDKELEGANTLYISLRYYFPVDNKFTWDRKTMKKKRERKKEKERRKKERESEDKKGLRKLFDFGKKDE